MTAWSTSPAGRPDLSSRLVLPVIVATPPETVAEYRHDAPAPSHSWSPMTRLEFAPSQLRPPGKNSVAPLMLTFVSVVLPAATSPSANPAGPNPSTKRLPLAS